MATGKMSKVIYQLCRAVLGDGGETDGQLLASFLAHREQAAFEALVQRHGRMVLGVCQRVLNHSHYAEDAFQATFLVLVRKAASLVARQTIGDWLFGVAYNTALKARAAAIKQRTKERKVAAMSEERALEDIWQDLRPLLDQEIHRLPEKYREAVVLCGLEGKA
jgi:RNA polymerase sigma factor (sigma-70 family)